MNKILLTNGDSWTWGSEIACPEILAIPGERGYGMAGRYKKDMGDWVEINDSYRIPKIWPSHLAKRLNMKDVNISWPARSNDTIYISTMGWVLDYLNRGGDPKDLTVIVGWSSPERRRVVIQEFDDSLHTVTLWPAMAEDQFYPVDIAKRYFKFYVQHLWLEREFITRYVEQNFNLHLFLKSHGIKHNFFNAFYLWNHTPLPVHKWKDVDLLEVITAWHTVTMGGHYESTWQNHEEIKRVLNMWKSIPSSVYLEKETLRSFKSHIDDNVPLEKRMINMHPSPDSHEAWAKHLAEVI